MHCHCLEVPRTSDKSAVPSPGILTPPCSLTLCNPVWWSGCPSGVLMGSMLSLCLRYGLHGVPNAYHFTSPASDALILFGHLKLLARWTSQHWLLSSVWSKKTVRSFSQRAAVKPGFLHISLGKLTLGTQELALLVILIQNHLVDVLPCKEPFESWCCHPTEWHVFLALSHAHR